jgi:hypothetical protein
MEMCNEINAQWWSCWRRRIISIEMNARTNDLVVRGDGNVMIKRGGSKLGQIKRPKRGQIKGTIKGTRKRLCCYIWWASLFYAFLLF